MDTRPLQVMVKGMVRGVKDHVAVLLIIQEY